MPPLDEACTSNDSYLLVANDDDASFPSTASTTTVAVATKRQQHKGMHHTRAVSFSETVQEHMVTTCLGMSASQRRAYWYSKYDMAVLQQSSEKIVRKMEQGTFQESSQPSSAKKAESAVGLLTEDEMIVKFRSIREARKVILKEQKSQRHKGISDAARIATLYKKKTLACRMSAVEDAVRVEQEVANHSNEPKRPTLAQYILSRMMIRRSKATTITSSNRGGSSTQSIGSTHKESAVTRCSSFTAPSPEPDRPLILILQRSLSHHNIKRGVTPGKKISIHNLMKPQQIAPLNSN
jgi:hypothetical protein